MTTGLDAAVLRQALTEILKRHILWVRTNGAEGERLSLRGANLTEVDMDGADLWKASLRKANLVGADFCEANLEKAVFWKASLTGADMGEADLQGIDFSEAITDKTPGTTPNAASHRKVSAYMPRS